MVVLLEPERSCRPCLLVVHRDPVYKAVIASYMRQFGWRIVQTSSGPQARLLAWRRKPTLVLLEADLDDESGWLTCAKLSEELPGARILLLRAAVTASEQRFARFVGAAGIVNPRDGLGFLAHELFATAMEASCA